MRDQFAADPHRFTNFSVQWDGLLLDYSKNRIDADQMQHLMQLAEEMQLHEAFQSMIAGEQINVTEGRAVLHTALRNFSDAPVIVKGQDVMPQIKNVLAKMRSFSEAVISGTWKGFSGKAIRNVVNIGIGGSDLGPNMVCEALKYYKVPHIDLHFVSNVDGSHIMQTLKDLDPETTLFLIASKTFTTQETMANAHTARTWLINAAGDEAAVAKHFVALSTAEKEVIAFGIDPENMFVFWDWVGGRYSLWSAIGLSICLAVGYDYFEQLLRGAHAVDVQTAQTPVAQNIPMLMALLGVWYNEWFACHTHAVIPYDQYLHRFTAFLQQADMESNGKSVHRNGELVTHATGPVIWGEPGTNGQHAFFQLMHQGTSVIPADFIVAAQPLYQAGKHHPMLLSNCLAQTAALMQGKDKETVLQELAARGMNEEQRNWHAPFRTFDGNRPTNTLILDKLTPYHLGMLIAIYEHKIFFQGILWDIYSFDQWGVELGKVMANKILPDIEASASVTTHDSSTNGLINYIRLKQ